MITKYLTEAARNADSRRINALAEDACDAGEITVDEAKMLLRLANATYRNAPTTATYRKAAAALTAWANQNSPKHPHYVAR